MEEKFQKEFKDLQKQNVSDTKMKKLFTIIGMTLLLLIPIFSMYGIISDRTNYRDEAVQKVAQSLAGSQLIGVPQMSFTGNSKGEIINQLDLNNYEANIKIVTEIRKKGIFKVPVYTAKVVQKGDFENKYGDLSGKQISTKIQVSDSSGFIEEPCFKINNASAVNSQDVIYTTEIKTNAKIIPFEITYKIRGLNEIGVAFGGQKNKISMQGNWKDPEFKGNFLPTERNVTQKDFTATWSVPKIALNQNGQQSIANVSLLVPVDNYSMSERALKYGFLLLALTFMGYFIFEITSKDDKKIHPIQYCLLGAAILIFYLLLVSLSEFIAFKFAYGISSLMVMGLIFTYTYFVITKKQNLSFSVGITGAIGLLYAYFYVLLKLQDIALLAGSIGLFIIISAIMYLTRNVSWYNEK